MGERTALVYAVALFAFLYGYAAHGTGVFPHSVLQRAWGQALAVAPFRAPDWVQPRVHDREGARAVEPERVHPGLTLVSTVWDDGGWLPGLKLIDASGRTLHEWRVDPAAALPDSASRRGIGLRELDVQGVHLFDDGDVVLNVEYAGALRLDACGEVRWSVPAGNHHSVAPAGDGSFWIPAVTSRPREGTPDHPEGVPGIEGPVYQDELMRVSADGEVLETHNVLDLLQGSGLARHIVKSGVADRRDVTHLNDVEPLAGELAGEYPLFEAGDLAVSLRNLDLVFVVDPGSGAVKWHASDPFVAQHDPDFLGDGWIGVFDNNRDGTQRGTVLGGSRIVALQPHTDSTKVLFPAPRSNPFHTHHRGKWQQLGNGNMLLTESAAGRVVEVGPEGETVWEWVSPPYDNESVPYVADGVRTDLRSGDVAGWPCPPDDAPPDRRRPSPAP